MLDVPEEASNQQKHENPLSNFKASKSLSSTDQDESKSLRHLNSSKKMLNKGKKDIFHGSNEVQSAGSF